MRLIFAGTPAFAAVALEAIHRAGHEVALVLTQPDRPRGRGMKVAASAVKVFAEKTHLPIFQPDTLKTTETQALLAATRADIMVVAAYGLILPQAILDIPRLGCLNIHASLLPRWRGAAPIQRAIAAGDTTSGVCIMQMEKGLDTGPVLRQFALPIAADDTAGSLHDKLATEGANLMTEVLTLMDAGEKLLGVPQSTVGISYAHKLEHADRLINWENDAAVIGCQIRALSPAPGAITLFSDQDIKIFDARQMTAPHQAMSGTVIAVSREGIEIACGTGSLSVGSLQKAGGKVLKVADFLAGNPIRVGEKFLSKNPSFRDSL